MNIYHRTFNSFCLSVSLFLSQFLWICRTFTIAITLKQVLSIMIETYIYIYIYIYIIYVYIHEYEIPINCIKIGSENMMFIISMHDTYIRWSSHQIHGTYIRWQLRNRCASNDLFKAFNWIESSHKSDSFAPKLHNFLHACATCSKFPSSNMVLTTIIENV